MSTLISGLLVLRVLGSLACFLAAMPVVRRRAVCRFYRRLRHSGLSRDVADELTESYAAGISLFWHRESWRT